MSETTTPDQAHFAAGLAKAMRENIPEGTPVTPELVERLKALMTVAVQQQWSAVAIGELAADIHAIHVRKQFYDEPKTVSHLMGLVMTELAETIEADRQHENDKPSEKIPEFTKEEEEVADAIIRLLDFSGYRKLRIGAAVLAKHEYNRSRPPKHGKRY